MLERLIQKLTIRSLQEESFFLEAFSKIKPYAPDNFTLACYQLFIDPFYQNVWKLYNLQFRNVPYGLLQQVFIQKFILRSLLAVPNQYYFLIFINFIEAISPFDILLQNKQRVGPNFSLYILNLPCYLFFILKLRLLQPIHFIILLGDSILFCEQIAVEHTVGFEVFFVSRMEHHWCFLFLSWLEVRFVCSHKVEYLLERC